MVLFESLGKVSYSFSIVPMAVSVAVCKIFSVKEWCDLENRVRVRSSHHLIDRIGVLFTFHSSLTMVIYYIVYDIQRLIGRKSRNFYTPPVFSAPAGGESIGIS